MRSASGSQGWWWLRKEAVARGRSLAKTNQRSRPLSIDMQTIPLSREHLYTRSIRCKGTVWRDWDLIFGLLPKDLFDLLNGPVPLICNHLPRYRGGYTNIGGVQ